MPRAASGFAVNILGVRQQQSLVNLTIGIQHVPAFGSVSGRISQIKSQCLTIQSLILQLQNNNNDWDLRYSGMSTTGILANISELIASVRPSNVFNSGLVNSGTIEDLQNRDPDITVLMQRHAVLLTLHGAIYDLFLSNDRNARLRDIRPRSEYVAFLNYLTGFDDTSGVNWANTDFDLEIFNSATFNGDTSKAYKVVTTEMIGTVQITPGNWIVWNGSNWVLWFRCFGLDLQWEELMVTRSSTMIPSVVATGPPNFLILGFRLITDLNIGDIVSSGSSSFGNWTVGMLSSNGVAGVDRPNVDITITPDDENLLMELIIEPPDGGGQWELINGNQYLIGVSLVVASGVSFNAQVQLVSVVTV